MFKKNSHNVRPKTKSTYKSFPCCAPTHAITKERQRRKSLNIKITAGMMADPKVENSQFRPPEPARVEMRRESPKRDHEAAMAVSAMMRWEAPQKLAAHTTARLRPSAAD